MKVWNMLHRLQDADPDAVVLYLPPYADDSDAEEICDVVLVSDMWTGERHRSADGSLLHVHHPAVGGLTLGNQATDEQWSERVVILTSAS